MSTQRTTEDRRSISIYIYAKISPTGHEGSGSTGKRSLGIDLDKKKGGADYKPRNGRDWGLL